MTEIRRIIDIYFRSTFTTDKELIDKKNNIYVANPSYKDKTFQEKYKYALLKILMDAYKRYLNNGSTLILPQSIIERTRNYLELSCNLLSWFKENYEITNDKKDICKMKDIYGLLIDSIYFNNLTKLERKKYNKSYLTEYVKNNIFLKKYYVEKSGNIRNSIIMWKRKEENDDDVE